MRNIQKRYIVLGIIVVMVVILIWRVNTSLAMVDQGYTGRNIISGDKWGVNIVEVSDIEKSGDALVLRDISTIGTTLNFDVILFNPGDKISFNITVKNTSSLNAELYALTLSGLSDIESENIDYTIMPIDSSIIHDDNKSGSIIKGGDKQVFNITVYYHEEAHDNSEHHLSLGSTIIYKQK